MKWTNIYNLPEAWVNLIKNQTYSKGHARISVTGLASPPQQRILSEKYRKTDKMVVDISSRIDAAIGTVIHKALEENTKSGITEEMLFMEVEGLPGQKWIVKGGFDWLDTKTHTLVDYKTTSIYNVKNGASDEFIAQLNCYIEMARKAGHKVDFAADWVYIKDWRPGESMSDPAYPPLKINKWDIEIWSSEKTQEYMKERVKVHQLAETNMQDCTAEERWYRDEKWAVQKVDAKRATRLHETEEAANLHVADLHRKNKGK
jgi:hypothetical protein